MKKIKYIILILIISISFVVKASSDNTNTKLSIDCSKNEFAANNTLSCDVNLTYSDTDITDIEFNYSSAFSMAFAKPAESKETISAKDGKVNVTFTNQLTGTKVSIAKITVTAGSILTSGKYDINLTNVKINNEAPISLENVKKTIEYVTEKDSKIDCSLESISINGENLSNFSKTKYSYDGLTSTQRMVSIDAKATSSKVSVTGLGPSFLSPNKITSVNIDVSVSPDSIYQCSPSSRTYTLNISYVTSQQGTNDTSSNGETSSVADEKSKDNSLSTLELYNGNNKLDFVFDNKKTSFDYKISADVEKLTVKATLSDEKASFVSKYGPRDITMNYGKNKIELRVKSESGDTKTYTLNVEREDTRSSDNSLSSLSINGKTIELISNQYEYSVDVPLSVLKTEVLLQTSNSNAKAEYKNIDLVDGENNLSIKVTSENNKTVEYKIKINRIEIEEVKNLLESITITGYDFPFKKDVMSYNLTIDKDTDKLEINVKPDQNIEVMILGNDNLVNNSTIVIRINDDEGEKSYTINIYKEGNSSLLNIVCYGVFGIGLISFISSIIYYCNKKKRK